MREVADKEDVKTLTNALEDLATVDHPAHSLAKTAEEDSPVDARKATIQSKEALALQLTVRCAMTVTRRTSLKKFHSNQVVIKQSPVVTSLPLMTPSNRLKAPPTTPVNRTTTTMVGITTATVATEAVTTSMATGLSLVVVILVVIIKDSITVAVTTIVDAGPRASTGTSLFILLLIRRL